MLRRRRLGRQGKCKLLGESAGVETVDEIQYAIRVLVDGRLRRSVMVNISVLSDLTVRSKKEESV